MKIVIGHKILNLEELYQISQITDSGPLAEVVVDSQIRAELSKADPKDKSLVTFSSEHAFVANCNASEVRAILAVKLLQILKLKSVAQLALVDKLVELLNTRTEFDKNFLTSLYGAFDGTTIFPTEKERFLLNSLPNVYATR